MKTLSLLLISLSIFILSACSSHIQTTSGKAYLDKYEQLDSTRNSNSKNIDDLVKEVANIEPTLNFPARIGLARIDNGKLTLIPGKETQYWQQSKKRLGRNFGEFIPINPIIVDMVTNSINTTQTQNALDIVAKIRLGAARQHLDAVLIYEVYSKEQYESNYLAIADLTIIGAYLLPSKSIDTQAFANALLIDVRNGYPYGTADAFLSNHEYASTLEEIDERGYRSNTAKTQVIENLTEEVEEMFFDLREALSPSK